MNFEPTTYTIRDERDRIDEQLDELAEKAASADDERTIQRFQQQAAELQHQLNGLDQLIDEYGPEATVTVEGLTTGGYAQVQDDIAQGTAPGESSPGARRNMIVGTGLVDAPFLEDTDADDRTATLARVAELPIGVTLWLEDRIDEETTGDKGNSKSFAERVREKEEGV